MSTLRLMPLVLAVAACSADELPSRSDLSPPSCAPLGLDGMLLWDPVDRLQLASEADFVGVALPGPWDALGEEGAYASERGERCADVADQGACEAQLQEWLETDYVQVLVTRRGDRVDFAAGEDVVAGLLPIDSLDEAMLVAHVAGYLAPWCDATESSDGGREVEDGYEVVLRGDIECTPTGRGSEQREVVYRHLLHVDPDGEITELDREVDSEGYCEDFCQCRQVEG